MIKLAYNHKILEVKTVLFSDGAIDFQILSDLSQAEPNGILNIEVDTSVPAASVPFLVRVVVAEFSALSNLFRFQFDTKLFTPYLPFARADRPFGTQQISMLENFVSMVSVFCEHIITSDAHNPEAMRKICTMAGVKYTNMQVHISTVAMLAENCDVLVAPDKGSAEKVLSIGELVDKPVVVMNKVRNPDTGKIESLEIKSGQEHIAGSKCLIVDDICDYGGTFKWASSVLDNHGALRTELYVTHMIAPMGVDAVKSDYLREVHYAYRIGGYGD